MFKNVFTQIQQKSKIRSQFTCLSQIGFLLFDVFTQQQDKVKHFIISGTLKTK